MERLWIAEGSTDSTRANAESGRTSMRRSASVRVASIPEGWQEHDQRRRERNGRRIYRNIREGHGRIVVVRGSLQLFRRQRYKTPQIMAADM